MSLPGWRSTSIWVACGHRWGVVDQINIPFFDVFRGTFYFVSIQRRNALKQNLMFHYRNELLFPKMFPKVSTPNTHVNCNSPQHKIATSAFHLTLVILPRDPNLCPNFFHLFQGRLVSLRRLFRMKKSHAKEKKQNEFCQVTSQEQKKTCCVSFFSLDSDGWIWKTMKHQNSNSFIPAAPLKAAQWPRLKAAGRAAGLTTWGRNSTGLGVLRKNCCCAVLTTAVRKKTRKLRHCCGSF